MAARLIPKGAGRLAGVMLGIQACHARAPRKQNEASGTQYFKQVVITWSIRSRGSVQRTQIITITPRLDLRIKFAQPARLAR